MNHQYCKIAIAASAVAFVNAAPAMAQDRPSIGFEAATDEARRGLSWSEGRAAVSADASGTIGPVEASARVVTLRDSVRHDGAWSVADLRLGTATDIGAVQLRAGATAHLFAGARSKMDYVELGASASYTYGPAQLTGGVELAPSQDAIGGGNVHLYANADAGIPGTPFTLIAGVGHSSGSVNDPIRAQRLRPVGSYANWRLGVEHRRGPLTLGLDYLGTDIDRADAFGPFADARHSGDRLVGRVRFAL
ncbi:TorF family putative porin [Sphingomonas sp. 37zxx]|uniref:TorF family putative porin n=1 Tax=Sphingomonas sp. 37zxx TaxID=1550073 RepID=UPI00053BFA93|nr:TorF family putative porin [Sphingomonas sp. 37zxx]